VYFLIVYLLKSCDLFLIVMLRCNNHSEPPPNEGGGDENVETTAGGLTDADFDSNWDESIESFDGMGLPEELLRGIYSYGFEKPSAIQQRAIKPTMLGRDLIAQAQSGTVSSSSQSLSKSGVICYPSFFVHNALVVGGWRSYLVMLYTFNLLVQCNTNGTPIGKDEV
jgi:hypothetical protein